MDKLVICLLTYARTDYALTTLKSTLERMTYNGEIHVHIADDGSEYEHRKILWDVAQEHPRVSSVSDSNSERGGYGKNYNLATQVIHDLGASKILVLEDDWELVKPLNMNVILADMHTDVRLRCVRLGYMSYTQELRGTIIDVGNRKYLLFDSNSPEPHIFAGHPRVESVAFQKFVGPWPEGLAPGATEFAVCHKPEARQGIVWPLEEVHPRGDVYAHIGATRAY